MLTKAKAFPILRTPSLGFSKDLLNDPHIYQAQILHYVGPKISTLWPPKNTLSVWFHSVGDNLNWEKLPIVCLSAWFHLISLFSRNNVFRAKMYRTLKINLSICYNFCKKYFFPGSIFIHIKWKNLLKTFFISFDLENQICRYVHHHIRNQRLKIHEYSEFQINRS